jgi:hypothetical protein
MIDMIKRNGYYLDVYAGKENHGILILLTMPVP